MGISLFGLRGQIIWNIWAGRGWIGDARVGGMEGGRERIGLVRAPRGRGGQLVHGASKIWRFQCILGYRVIVAVYLGESHSATKE